MPYSSTSELPDYVKKLPEKKQRQWMHIFNSVFAERGEEAAFRVANGTVKKTALGRIVKILTDIGIVGPLEKTEMSSASINDLPDSAFAYIEPGGTKDESGKTTPRSLRHFPVHDEAHARNALARMSQSPFGEKARAEILAACHRFGIKVSEDTKKEDGDFQKDIIIKTYEIEKRLVYGVVYAPFVHDTDDEWTTPEEIEKAAHNFLPNALMNIEHKDNKPDVEVVESYLAPCNFTLNNEEIIKGTWLIVSRVNDDELWEAVKKGEITGYSMEGRATRSSETT